MHAYFDGLILRLLKSTCFHVIKRSNASYQLVVSAPGEQDQYLLFDYLPTFKLSRRSLQRIHDDLTWNIILNVGGVHVPINIVQLVNKFRNVLLSKCWDFIMDYIMI